MTRPSGKAKVMPTWDVELFCSGTVHIQVEAATEQEAEEKARNTHPWCVNLDDVSIDELHEAFEITEIAAGKEGAA